MMPTAQQAVAVKSPPRAADKKIARLRYGRRANGIIAPEQGLLAPGLDGALGVGGLKLILQC